METAGRARIAELERALSESQTDYRVQSLDRNLEEANEQIAMLTKQDETNQKEIVHLRNQIKVLVQRVDIWEKSLAETQKGLKASETINFERWRQVDEHVERVRDESNSKHEAVLEGLSLIEKKIMEVVDAFEKKAAARDTKDFPLIFSDTAMRAHAYANHLGLKPETWIHVLNPDYLRGIERTRVFYVDWPLTNPSAVLAYEKWRNPE